MDAVCKSTFQQYDTNGDGVITLEEFTERLATSLRLAEAVNGIYGGKREHGAITVDVKVRAKQTAMHCFDVAGVTFGGSLTLPLFTKWFYATPIGDTEVSPI